MTNQLAYDNMLMTEVDENGNRGRKICRHHLQKNSRKIGDGSKPNKIIIKKQRQGSISIMFSIFGIAESLEGEAAMRLEMEEVIKRMLK